MLTDLIDDPKLFSGAPVGLQVVGKHLRDEETVAAAKVIEAIIRNATI